MPRLPDETSFGGRATPQPARGVQDPRAAASPAAANAFGREASMAGKGLYEIGESVGQIANEIAVGEERIRLREEALLRDQAEGTYAETAAAEYQRMLKEDDISSVGANRSFSEFLRTKRDEILNGHEGSDESRLMLSDQLLGVEQSYAAKATQDAFEAQQKKVGMKLGATLNSVVNSAYDPNSDLVSMFRQWDSKIANFAPAMTADEERTWILGGREKIAEARLTSLIYRGQAGVDQAETLLTNPHLQEVLGPGAQARIRGRLAAIQQQRAEAAMGPVFGMPRDIWDGLSEEQKSAFFGAKAGGSDKAIEVGDPDSPTGTRWIPESLAMSGQPLDKETLSRYPMGKPPSGLDVRFGEGGTVKSITTGRTGGAGGDLSAKTTGSIEQKLFEAQEGLARLDQVRAAFKPEYQTFETRADMKWTALMEKAGRDISEEDKQQLTEFSDYKRESIDNINRYIKEITGAQMSEPEAERIRKGMPDPGEGVFDGDSPTEFRAKMDSTIRSLRLATARYVWALRNGLDPVNSGQSLEGIQKIMRSRMEEIADEIRTSNPDMAPEMVDRLLRQRLGAEFGLI